jgi:flagellar hook-length control protein FliK
VNQAPPVAGNTAGGADSEPVTTAPILTGLLDDAAAPTTPATLAASDLADDKPAFALPANDAASRPQTPSLSANDILAESTDPLAALPAVRAESVVAAVENLKAGIEPAPGAAATEPRLAALPITAGVEPLTGPGGMTAATAPAPAGGQVNVPFGHAAWGQAFSNQVVWAMNQGLPTAALHLSPAELGPVSVQIRLDQDQASVSFVSAHAAVRDAIEAALPRLRDMLGAQGITLADVNVSQHGQSQHAQRDPAGAGYAHAGSMTDSGEELPAAPLVVRARGMLDVYA